MKKFKWVLVGAVCLAMLYLMVRPFIDVLIYSVFVYYTTRPLYKALKKRVKSKMLAANISLILVVLPVTIVLLYTVGVASIELLNLAGRLEIPYFDIIRRIISDYAVRIRSLEVSEVFEIVRSNPDFKQVGDLLFTLSVSTLDIVFRLFLVYLVSSLLLREGSMLSSWCLDNIFCSDTDLCKKFMDGVDRDLKRVFYGNIITAVAITFIAVVLFSILNSLSPGVRIPYPVLLSILCGFASLIPGIGVAVVYAPAALILGAQAYFNGVLAQQWWFILLFFASTAIIADIIPNWVVRPMLSSREINEELMLFAYIFGPLAFGLSGLVLGPIILVVAMNFVKTVLPSLNKG
ncbi:MAG: AI-2E family transporter [Candidatus Altiarchaeota archaeon]